MALDSALGLSSDTVAVIGTTFGASLTSLQVDLAISDLNPSFWQALAAQHLPNLRRLVINSWRPSQAAHADALAELAGLVAAYSGQPFTITFSELSDAGEAALCAALNLPASDTYSDNTVHLQLPQL